MPSVIVLSSSPPPMFAKSPTPADYTSPRNTSNTNLNGDTPSRKRFKSIETQKDGFSGGFSTARQVLAEKNGDLNRFMSSPGRNKFKTGQITDATTSPSPSCYLKEYTSEPRLKEIARNSHGNNAGGADNIAVSIGRQEQPEISSPLIVQRAVSRRTDWTPPRPDTFQEKAPGFPANLLTNFEYDANVEETNAFVAGSEAHKRRKLVAADAAVSIMDIGMQIEGNTVSKRTKSSTKKALTITGLATSNFIGQRKGEELQTLQQPILAQEQLSGVVANTGLYDSKVKQTKAAVAKIRKSRKSQPASRLVSPTSALKLLEEQETLFGSASQLWKAEPKPTVSMANVPDPFSFPGPFSSSPLSQGLTPKTGIARFKRSRNLWAAAGRDEDNALLHVDTVDLTESPEIREALAGKNVMVQQNTKRTHDKSAASSHRIPQSSFHQKRPSILDIDDIVTPGQSPSTLTASFHTSAKNVSPRRKQSLAMPRDDDASSESIASKATKPVRKKPQPKKPHFAGLSDHDLKKQISNYGFKAVRKREKMIELLEKCWAEKYGSSEQPADPETDKSGYGDILSHIHDVSARPTPKVKKVAKPRKKKDETPKTPAVKKPRQRKAKTSEGSDAITEGKITRKRKTKANAVPEELIYDIEDLNDPAVKERRELGRFDDWALPAKTPKRPQSPDTLADLPSPPPTFPPTLAETVTTLKKTPTDTIQPRPVETQEKILPTPDDSQRPDMFEQITRAINHESFTSNVHIKSPSRGSNSSSSTTTRRNHQTHPTWHEKILMYDPIVLEDLAAWLNTKGLSEIGEDREVSAVELRTWCESRGICCLWKGGWRGLKGGE